MEKITCPICGKIILDENLAVITTEDKKIFLVCSHSHGMLLLQELFRMKIQAAFKERISNNPITVHFDLGEVIENE